MSEIDRFFNDEIHTIEVESKEITIQASRELEANIQKQIKQNFNSTNLAFSKGIKVYEFENASYVRLSPLLSNFADPQPIKGNPNLWILLPSGQKLGFKRLSKRFTYPDLKRRYGSRLSFVPIGDGHVVLFRQRNGTVTPIYKLQPQVSNKQKIKFYETAKKIVNKYNV